MQQSTIVIIAAVVVLAVLLLLFLIRGRKQHVDFDALKAPPPSSPTPRAMPPASPPAPAVPDEEGHGVGSEVAAAVEDVLDQLIGIDAHHSGQQAVRSAGDDLTVLKGLGPKAAARLHEIGVTTYAQIAAWDEGDVAAIDAQMGAFKGRITRDRWVEQAKLLATGDTTGFEAAFGKLG